MRNNLLNPVLTSVEEREEGYLPHKLLLSCKYCQDLPTLPTDHHNQTDRRQALEQSRHCSPVIFQMMSDKSYLTLITVHYVLTL